MTVNDITQIHDRLVRLFANGADPITPAGTRDENLLESAAARPHVAIGGTEKYETVETKGAALFHSLVMNHPFHNGNKRTALVSLLVFLERNRRRIRATDDELFDFVLAVANGRYKQETATGHADELLKVISQWINIHTSTGSDLAVEMKTADFLECCRRAGAEVRDAGGGVAWLVRGPNRKSIRVGKDTRQLGGKVIKRYLQMVGLSPAICGIHVDEFQAGVDPQQELIRRFRGVLDRLAHA